MATLVTPSVPKNLDIVHLRSIAGITEEDIEEMRILGIVSVGALMSAMDATGGHLENLSNSHAVIEDVQGVRITDALINSDVPPEAWRKRWTPSIPPPAPAVSIPVPAPAQPSFWTRVVTAWNAA